MEEHFETTNLKKTAKRKDIEQGMEAQICNRTKVLFPTRNKVNTSRKLLEKTCKEAGDRIKRNIQ